MTEAVKKQSAGYGTLPAMMHMDCLQKAGEW
jgi:hypothetical protein